VVGDPTYARRDPLGVGRQFLHSYRIALSHPVTGEALLVESPLPPDLDTVLQALRRRRPA
jgi:23S rRNA pseudouridine1911/1915/1917 synthase